MKIRFRYSQDASNDCWLFAAVIVRLLLSGSVHAELPREVYEKWQRDAPECLTIDVVCVRTRQTSFPDFVDIALLEAKRNVLAGDIAQGVVEKSDEQVEQPGPRS